MNIFPGINPILTSNLLANGRWPSLHGGLIERLSTKINEDLPEGYIAFSEDSIAMRVPDILVRIDDPPPLSPEAFAEIVTDDEHTDQLAIGVYQDDSAVAWLEILSPSNKRGRDLELYRAKRTDIINAGITFVEIELLPIPPSTTIQAITDYHDSQAQEFERIPFHIWSVSTRFSEDHPLRTNHIALKVGDIIKTITIPLLGTDVVDIQLGVAYERLWENKQYAAQSQNVAPRLVNDFPLYRDLVYIAATLANSTANKATPSPELLQSLNHDPQRVADILGVADLPDTTPSGEYG